MMKSSAQERYEEQMKALQPRGSRMLLGKALLDLHLLLLASVHGDFLDGCFWLSSLPPRQYQGRQGLLVVPPGGSLRRCPPLS